MENVHKIKIKLENIWIDLIMGIYAPYRDKGEQGQMEGCWRCDGNRMDFGMEKV